MLVRCGWLACLMLTSCSQLEGLADFGTGTIGRDEDASASATGREASGGPVPNLQAGEQGVIGSASDGAGGDATGDEGSAQEGGASSDAAFEASADANVDAEAGEATDAGTDAQPDSGADAQPDVGIDAAPDGPILTYLPSDASLSILAVDAGVCSLNGAQTAALHLFNARDAGATLEWVGAAPSCSETSYGNVASGGTLSISTTYVTHVWRIRNQADSQFLVEFRIDSPANYTVTVH
jgi:hypothetical protein